MRGYQLYALRAAFDLPVQLLTHLIDEPTDLHEIIGFGFMSAISGRYVGYCSG